MAEMNQDEQLRQLVLQAFARAREGGKDNWDQMRPAVLKNRLLDATERAFDEGEYGMVSVRQIPERLPDLLELDDVARTLRLKAAGRKEVISRAAAPRGSRHRVRSDLWDAVIDFRSGTSWVWDENDQVARPQAGASDAAVPIPSISANELAKWRADFVASHRAELEVGDDDLVGSWVESGRSSALLPPTARGRWFEYLKDKVIDRLESWFTSEGIASPGDLLGPRPEHRSDDEVHRLRKLITECVGEMTLDELRSVPIPARVLLRFR